MADPILKRLAQRIERLGMVTAPFRDHVAVRLPLFCHVRVSVVAGRLHCEPYTGAIQRTRGTALMLLVFTTIISSTFRREGVGAEAMTLGFLAVLAFAWETFRYILTESCITRVQALVLAEPALLDDAASLAGDQAPALGIGQAPAQEVRAAAGERVRTS